MYFPSTLTFLIPCFLHCISRTSAIPATPSGSNNGGGTTSLTQPGRGTTFDATLIPLQNFTGGGHTIGRRPRSDKLWPTNYSGRFYCKFHNYGSDIPVDEGKRLMVKATNEVDEWILASRSGSYTPVDHDHYWDSNGIRLTTRRGGDGYSLGDLQRYLNLMATFFENYQEYFEWDAELLVRSGFLGIISLRGHSSFRRIQGNGVAQGVETA
ncbi:MAG: hypothetical protein L6R37_004759 [Teloschistes peruensis]|nr:MAG: hypothetical protein L6R37_004759 [Teloschistes peruensis]